MNEYYECPCGQKFTTEFSRDLHVLQAHNRIEMTDDKLDNVIMQMIFYFILPLIAIALLLIIIVLLKVWQS